jgi:pentose-5-phosphate-3-epimerase
LTINGIVNVSNISSLNNTATNYTVTNFNDGTYDWNMTCWDVLDNANTSETRNFTIDSTEPAIALNNPPDNYSTKQTDINFTWTATDNFDTNLTCNLTIDGAVNVSNIASLNNTPTNYTVTGFNDGNHYWNVTCIDDLNNTNTSETRQFIIDTTQPAVALNFPQDNYTTQQTEINFTWTATNGLDTNLTCNLTIDGTVNVSNIASLNNTPTNYTVTGFSDGMHYWNVTCIDDANNVNISETRQFIIATTEPTIALNFPPDNYTTKQTEINFTWTTTTSGMDTNLTCNLTIDGAVNASNIASLNNTATNYTVTGFDDGTHYWNVTCIDDANNVNTSETRQFTIDTTQPAVALNFPPDNYTTKQTDINFTWTATNGLDTNLTCNLTIDGIVNASNIASLNNTPTNYTVNNFADGIHYWNVSCIDDANNVNTSETRQFTIDTTQPAVALNFPPDNYTTKQTDINFTWTATNGLDTNLTCNLTIDGAVNASNIASLNNTLTNYTVTNFADGIHYWNVSCIDDANNVNTSETRQFTIDTTQPAVALNFPQNNYITQQTSINFTWTATNGLDTNLTCNLTIDGALNASNIASLNNTPTNYTVTNFNEGQHNWSVACVDDSNNVNTSETRNFTIDNTEPAIVLNSPPNNSITNSTSATFNWTAIDNLDTNLTCNLTLDNVVRASNVASLNNTPTISIVSSLTNGTHYWNVTCIDHANKVNTSETRALIVNISGPTVILNFPPDNYLTSLNSINFNWTATDVFDSNLTCNLTIDGTVNASNIASLNNTPTNYSVSGFSDGTHSWSVLCLNDNNQTGVSATRNFTIDTTKPSISLNFPAANYTTKQTDINFTWTATNGLDTNLTCNLTIDGAVNISNIASLNNTPTNYTVTGFDDGQHYWNVTCIDDANNVNTSETRQFTIDTTAPSVALNYPPNFAVTTLTSLNFNWTATNGLDTNLTCNLTINGVVNASNIASLNNTPTNYTVDNFADGTYYWNVSCVDDANVANTSETRQFIVDTTEPAIALNFPQDNYITKQTEINFTWTTTDNTDTNMTCNLTIDGQVNVSNIASLNNTPANYTVSNTTCH